MSLPGYVFVAILAVLAAAAGNAVALRGWRRSAGEHWTERARVLWPVRVHAPLTGMSAGMFAMLLWHCIVPTRSVPTLHEYGFASWFGSFAGAGSVAIVAFPGVAFPRWWHQAIAHGAPFLLDLAVIVGTGVLMPPRLDGRALMLAAASLGVLALLHVSLAGPLLRALGGFRRDAALDASVREWARPWGVDLAGAWVFDGVYPDVHALPVTHELWFSRQLLEVCTPQEVRAVATHEIVRLAGANPTRFGRLAASLALWPLVFWRPLNAWTALAPPLVMIATFVVLIRVANERRRYEERADRMAAEPQREAYAVALEKIQRLTFRPAVYARRARGVDNLYDRMAAAGATPAYPRPLPPSVRIPWPTVVLCVLWFAAAGGTILRARAEHARAVSAPAPVR